MSILIWGHRGHRHHRFAEYYGEGTAYENSLQAYKDTLDAGFGLECDVVQSKEATLYLAHDTGFSGIVRYDLQNHLREQDKKIAGSRYIYQMPDEDIRRFKLKDGQAIPSLRELLSMMRNYPGREVNIELKGPRTMDTALRTVEKAIQQQWLKPEQVVFSSFNFPALRDLRAQTGSRFKIAALFALRDQTITPMFPNWPFAPQDANYIPFKAEENVLQRDDVRAIAPDFFSLEIGTVDEETIERIAHHYPQAKLVVWMAGERHPADNAAFVEAVRKWAPTKKIHAIISDFPQDIYKRLRENEVAVEKV